MTDRVNVPTGVDAVLQVIEKIRDNRGTEQSYAAILALVAQLGRSLQSEHHTLRSDHDTLRTEYEQLRERVEGLEEKLSPSM